MKINQLLTPYNRNVRSSRNIKYIVIHYVGATGGAEANCKYYASKKIGASAHYYVGHSGEIWQSVLDKDIAWHCGGKKYANTSGGSHYGACTNSNSIGIELCCRKDPWRFEDVTVDIAVELTKFLMNKYNVPITRVIRHYDVVGKICPAPFVNDANAWNNFKNRCIDAPVTNVSTSSNTSTSTPTSISSSLLKNGSRGQAVVDLQNKLNNFGYDCGEADGIFGSKTLAAVKDFQKANGLSVDGIVGDKTRAALNSAKVVKKVANNSSVITNKPTTSTPTLSSSTSSSSIKYSAFTAEYQNELNKQFNRGLVVDGLYGNKTHNAGVNIRKGARGKLTNLLQRLLSNKTNYFNGAWDGIFGVVTETAVMRFQKENGLTIDGIVGKNTWRALLTK